MCGRKKTRFPKGKHAAESAGIFPDDGILYRCEDCSGCPCRRTCCKAKDDNPKELRIQTDLIRLSGRSQRNIETERGITLRVNRSIQVEGAFGLLKHDRKFKRFLTCGRANISTELFLLCLGYNLKKLWAKCNAGRLKKHLFCVKKE